MSKEQRVAFTPQPEGRGFSATKLMNRIDFKKYIPSIYTELLDAIAQTEEFYLVGGFVRDVFLGHSNTDIDICCSEETRDRIAKLCTAWGITVNYDGLKFGVITAYLSKEAKIDVAMFRTEAYSRNSRKPITNSTKDIIEDLSRRDFTINAMAINYQTGELIDPFGGADDLAIHKILRAVGDPKKRFSEDPLRMLRAIRFASRFSLDIDPYTLSSIIANTKRLEIISGERIREELVKGFYWNPRGFFMLLVLSSLFEEIFPEYAGSETIRHDSRGKHYGETLRQHLFDSMDNLASAPESEPYLFSLALMLHDIGKPSTLSAVGSKYMFLGHETKGAEIVRYRMKKLKFSTAEIRYLSLMAQYHAKIHAIEKLDAKPMRAHLAEIYQETGESLGLMTSLIRLCEYDGNKRDNSQMYKYVADFFVLAPAIAGEDVMRYPEASRGKIIKRMRYLQLANGLNREETLKLLKSEAGNIIAVMENKNPNKVLK